MDNDVLFVCLIDYANGSCVQLRILLQMPSSTCDVIFGKVVQDGKCSLSWAFLLHAFGNYPISTFKSCSVEEGTYGNNFRVSCHFNCKFKHQSASVKS
jgi:hypothetical protein